jgi:hypothetical protein
MSIRLQVLQAQWPQWGQLLLIQNLEVVHFVTVAKALIFASQFPF